MIQHIVLLLALAAPAPLPGADGVVVFLGPQGGTGNVVIANGTGPDVFPPELQGIRLLALDFNGRTEVQRFLGGRPRRLEDVPGAARLLLPQGMGSLYRYARDEAAGGTTFGLFIVDASGDTRSILELPGVGANGSGTPFKPRIAVAPDGASLLVATVVKAGGDLLEIDVATGAVSNRTITSPPLFFARGSLALASGWGVAAAHDRVLRFSRTPGAQVEAVAFGPTKLAWYSGEVALSSNGLHAVSTAGSSSTSAHVWSFAATGAALRASEVEMHLSGAGFLPESSHGPYLAVSDDGARVAWATEGVTHEAWLGMAQPVAGSPSIHLTSDALYLDTLDEIGQFMFRAITGTLLFSVGEAQGPLLPGIEALDFYEADLQASGLTLTNLSQSNGVPSAPFFVKSQLKPEATAVVPGTAARLFFNDQSGGSGELLRVAAGQTGSQVVLSGVKDLDALVLVGGDFMVVVRRSTGNQQRELWHVAAADGTPTLVLSMPETHTVARTATRSDGWFGFVQETPNKERLWLVDPTTFALRKLGRPLFFGPTLGFAPTGELAFTVGTGGIVIKAVLPISGPPQRIGLGTAPGFVLPGS